MDSFFFGNGNKNAILPISCLKFMEVGKNPFPMRVATEQLQRACLAY